jgi:hypothetical protein
MSKRAVQVRKTAEVAVFAADGTPGSPEHNQIARRAYELWQKRGCPIGSPEQDWSQARAELENREMQRNNRSMAAGG